MGNEQFPIILETPKTKIRFNPEGLSPEDQSALITVAEQVFSGARQRFRHALERCTFFAETGFDALNELVAQDPRWQRVRIEGSDKNPFDQHYWVAGDLNGESVVLDPIFGYVGTDNAAGKVLNDDHLRYYRTKREVPAHTPAWEGGVRVKTTAI